MPNTQVSSNQDEHLKTRPPCAQTRSLEESPLEQGVEFIRRTVRRHPEAAALWCLGIGFVLGWKLKPW